MVVAYYLGGRLGTSLIGLGKMVKNGTVERGQVGTRRNDVALLKIREPLLQKIGFYFITKTYAKAGRVLVCSGEQKMRARWLSNAPGNNTACMTVQIKKLCIQAFARSVAPHLRRHQPHPA